MELDESLLRPPSVIHRLQKRRWLLVGLVTLGLVALVLSGLALWNLAHSGADWRGWRALITPGLAPTDRVPPPSLREVAQQYPELADLLNDTSLGSVYKEFIITYERGGLDAAKTLAMRRGLLNDREEIRIALVVDSAANVQPVVQELKSAGITVEGSYRERINVGVPLTLIQRLAEEQGTDQLFERLTQMEHIIRLELPLRNRPDRALGVEGEGVSTIGADAWHASGFTGQGVRIGVLDLGFDNYRDLLGSELPQSVLTESFIYGLAPDETGEAHGTACAEIIHEVAPDAELLFACYDGSLVSEGQAVEWLMAQGVHVISHSAGSVMGPMDGTGGNAELADEAADQGTLWVNSSGNEAQGHYRGQFTDSDGDGLHEFPDGDEDIALWPYASDVVVVLNWDDWHSVTEDYDIHVYDAQGDLLTSAEDVQDGSPGQVAAEGLNLYDVTEGVYYVAIEAYQTSRAGVLDLYTPGAEIEFPVGERSLGTPADARGALTVGATDYRDDGAAPYSSQGPTTDGRLKPELCAPTGVSGVTYGTDGFDGTSASAPHVAGAAALVWSAFPHYGVDQVSAYLEARAMDLGPPGPDNRYGHGRVQLSGAPEEAEPTLPPVLTQLPPVPSLPVETVVPTVPSLSTATLTPAALPTATSTSTAAPIAARTSEPTPVAIQTPIEFGASGTENSRWLLLLLGMALVGLCGGAAVVGGVALLVAARRRARQPASQAVSPLPSPFPPTKPLGEKTLQGSGLAPTPLEPGVTTLGRSHENDLVLQDPKVSRYHARLVCSEDGCSVQDLGSVNGTFVNDRRVGSAWLTPGDRLRLGDVELTYGPVEEGRHGAWLEVNGREYPVRAAGATIGRAADNAVRVGDELASRRHARVEQREDEFVITDLGSTNGTYVNGRRVHQQSLRAGDEIRVGRVRMRFQMRS
jgi:pSer/pThr/pTyr-binding forkhead associated (FHA) protein/subtilisin family serine protease